MGAPPVSRARANRTARWVLVIVATLLVALAVPAVVWLSHTGPLPSTAALHCTDVDPFRCHDSATKAAAAVRPGANNGLAPLMAVGRSGFEIVEIGVRQGSLPRTACDVGPCPPAIAHLLEQISYVDIVTVHYQDGRLPPPQTTGSVEVRVTRYRDGREELGLSSRGAGSELTETPTRRMAVRNLRSTILATWAVIQDQDRCRRVVHLKGGFPHRLYEPRPAICST